MWASFQSSWNCHHFAVAHFEKQFSGKTIINLFSASARQQKWCWAKRNGCSLWPLSSYNCYSCWLSSQMNTRWQKRATDWLVYLCKNTVGCCCLFSAHGKTRFLRKKRFINTKSNLVSVAYIASDIALMHFSMRSKEAKQSIVEKCYPSLMLISFLLECPSWLLGKSSSRHETWN